MIDFENQQWTKNMSNLLLKSKTYSEETESPLPLDKVQEVEERYQKIIEKGCLANPLKNHKIILIPFDYLIAYQNNKKKYWDFFIKLKFRLIIT